MKKVILTSVLFLSLILLVNANPNVCNPQVTLISQDPYPAVPGDLTKIVFQIDGLSDDVCGEVSVELVEKHPITIDPSTPSEVTIKSGIYAGRNYEEFVMVPYNVRLDEDTFDGENPTELLIKRDKGAVSYEFDLNVEETRTEFEVYVKDYDYEKNELTLEVLNIGSVNIEALTLEIPKQEGIEIKGSSRTIVGDLDSNEYTSAYFEATAEDGEFEVILHYSDMINVRRNTVKKISFESSNFQERAADKKQSSSTGYIVWGVIILGIIYYIYRKKKKSKSKK